MRTKNDKKVPVSAESEVAAMDKTLLKRKYRIKTNGRTSLPWKCGICTLPMVRIKS